MNLTREAFIQKAESRSVVLLYEDLICDTVTPVALYAQIRGPDTFLLESADPVDRFGRYSFLGLDPKYTLRWREKTMVITGDDGCAETLAGDPFDILKQVLHRYRPLNFEGLQGYHGGAVGFLAYGMIQAIEHLEFANADDLDLPDLSFMIPKKVIMFDLFRHTMRFMINVFVDEAGEAGRLYDEARRSLKEMTALLQKPQPLPVFHWIPETADPKFQSNMTPETFYTMVDRSREAIRQGEAIQIVVSQRFEAPYGGDALGLYRALRLINPSPYMFCMEFPGFALVGSSPEILVKEEKGRVVIRPIAGTRPRGKTESEDRQLEAELLADTKEIAEHVMLVDLARNDIGRVCAGGSVHADTLMVIERYSHVMHIVSNVTGRLNEGKDAFDLIRATFPAGTVSGAPKIRAMEIIQELEPTPRGPYAGAVCYFDFGGDFDSCITIRTMLLKDGKAYIQAGAGIVYDSDSRKEYQETISKARALMRALEMARHFQQEKGL